MIFPRLGAFISCVSLFLKVFVSFPARWSEESEKCVRNGFFGNMMTIFVADGSG